MLRNDAIPIQVTASFTAEPLEEPILFWLQTLGLNAHCRFSGYGQVFQEALDPHSASARNENGVNVFLVESNAVDAAEFERALHTLLGNTTAPAIVVLCPSPDTRIADSAEDELVDRLEKIPNVYVVGTQELLHRYPVDEFFDAIARQAGDIPYTDAAFAAIAAAVIRCISAAKRRPYKAIVLDCDNTLWSGIVGEDGVDGIRITEGHRALQDFLLQKREQGMLLCLCSKNNRDDVDRVFRDRVEMQLRLPHIVASEINWDPKSENLRRLARQLNLGLDSFIFLDDNPAEVAEVAANCPEVVALQLPEDPCDFADFLQHVWAFDSTGVTSEDAARSDFYRQENERNAALRQANSFIDFLRSLDLRTDIAPPADKDWPRVSQLTARTNQFNANPVPRSVPELQCHLQDSDAVCLAVRAADRFGDYGLVGAITYRCEDNVLVADTFLLSCRALGKGVERAMLIELGKAAQARGAGAVEIIFTATERNHPCREFLESIATTDEISESPTSFRFRISADDAAALSPFPDRPHSTSTAATEAKTRIEIRGAFTSQLAQQIATGLRRPADVVARIRSRRRPRPDLPQPFVAATTAAEKKVAAIWSDVLGIDGIGRFDRFSELGGNSLAAARVLSRAFDTFGVKLPLGVVFESPILADLAARLSAAATAGSDKAATPLSIVTKADASPVPSPSQKRMWFLDRFKPGMKAYNIPACFRLDGPLNREAFQRALDSVASRHEAFRCTFPDEDGQAVVRIASEPELPLAFIDLSDVAEDKRGEAAAALVNTEAGQPFDLENGPLARAGLIRLSETENLFTLTIHHIIADGWSMGVIFRDLADAYHAFRALREPRSAPLQIQYSDFASWQIALLDEGAFDDQLAYWKETLSGVPAVLELPTDHPRPPALTYRGAIAETRLEADLVEELESLSRANEASLFMVLLAGFQILLQRYTGQDDVLVGTAVAGRPRPELERIVGCFVNTLVLRSDLSGDPSFTDFLARVRRCTMDALANQDLPFDRLVDELDLARDLSHSPLFQVMFVLQNTPGGDFDLPGLRTQSVRVHNGGSKFDLVLEMTQGAEGIDVVLEYNSDLFERDTACRMLDNLSVLLRGIVASPLTPITELPLLTAKERQLLLHQWNPPTPVSAEPRTLHEMFEARADQTPQAIAVTCDDQSLTYAQLNCRSNQLAHVLRDRYGVGPDTLVGICTERSLDTVIGILAILKAGGAYVPIDLAYPAERLAFMLEDCHAPVLLTQSGLVKQLPQTDAAIVCIDDLAKDIAGVPETNPDHGNTPADLAYVIYTSGSTGKPKGALVTHDNVLRLFTATDHWFQFNQDDVWTLFHSYAFDFSVWEIWGALLYGGRLVVVPYLLSRSPEDFYALLSRENVTVLNQTPSAFRQLIQVEGAMPEPLPLALRYVVFGGEALEMKSLAPWFERHGDQQPKLINMYGITETTVHVTYRPLSIGDLDRGSVIGIPIPDLQVYILDRKGNPVPIGVPGEMFVGGKGLARGYLNRDQLTAQRFIQNPFSSQGGDRLYRTGDLARFLPGRDIEYLGRIDDQVKLRGFRIELGEIESVLCEHRAVREAIVTVREDNPGEKRLAAYVVCDQPQPSISQLRDHLKDKLPEYMVPAAFVYLDKLPLTNNGKVDRRALPAPDTDRPDLDSNYLAPRSAGEKKLSNIWAKELRIERVGIDDNYFDLGGNSLLMVRIHRNIQNDLGRQFPLVTLFQYPTIRSLAQYLSGIDQQSDQATDVRNRAQRQRNALGKVQQRFKRQGNL